MTSRRAWIWLPVLILLLTVGQLAVAELVPGIDRFANKAFGARLVTYPILMSVVPVTWWLVVGRHRAPAQPPYVAFGLIMAPFLIDTTGNSLDLYDTVRHWDDLNHFVNWFLLLTGLGLVIGRAVRPAWAMVLMVTGLGCLLALGWELGEWYTFIRHGTELQDAYQDTLGDLTLGTSGSLLAALVVRRRLGPPRA